MSAIVTITLNPAVDIYTSVAKLAPVHKLRCDAERRDPGGGGINVARVISRLGGDVTAVYPAGGPIGQYLQQLVQAEGVVSHLVRVDGVTRENFTVRETETENEFRFVLPGPVLCAVAFDALLSAMASMSAARWIVASGGLPPGAPADAHARLARMAKDVGARFVLDASGDALRHGLREGVYLVKPNVRELSEFVGAPLDDEQSALDAARGVIASGGAEVVALSRGSDGAILVTADEAWNAPAVPVPVASSVGAGDSFLGALVWSLDRGHALPVALGYALAAGAAALLRPGTALCHADEVMRLAEKAFARAR